jgi:hypothetical protein
MMRHHQAVGPGRELYHLRRWRDLPAHSHALTPDGGSRALPAVDNFQGQMCACHC